MVVFLPGPAAVRRMRHGNVLTNSGAGALHTGSLLPFRKRGFYTRRALCVPWGFVFEAVQAFFMEGLFGCTEFESLLTLFFGIAPTHKVPCGRVWWRENAL